MKTKEPEGKIFLQEKCKTCKWKADVCCSFESECDGESHYENSPEAGGVDIEKILERFMERVENCVFSQRNAHSKCLCDKDLAVKEIQSLISQAVEKGKIEERKALCKIVEEQVRLTPVILASGNCISAGEWRDIIIKKISERSDIK